MTRLFAIADLHLALARPSKSMEKFGATWHAYHQKLSKNWDSSVAENDIVLIPGDISWAHSPEEATVDLQWLDARPGKKVLIRGNHDSWWSSQKKLDNLLPTSCYAVHTKPCQIDGYAFVGTRLWEHPEIDWQADIEWSETPPERHFTQQDQRIWNREIERLRTQLASIDPQIPCYVLVHYPPYSTRYIPDDFFALFKERAIHALCFGHIHNIRINPSRAIGAIPCYFCAADYLQFKPLALPC